MVTKRMRNRLLGVAVTAGAVLCGSTGQAVALPFVAANSPYNLTLANAVPVNANLFAATATFDGVPESFALIAGGERRGQRVGDPADAVEFPDRH